MAREIALTTTFSDNPDDGVYLGSMLILGVNPEKHKIAFKTPYHYLLIVPRADVFDGQKVVRLAVYDMNGPAEKAMPEWLKGDLTDGDGPLLA